MIRNPFRPSPAAATAAPFPGAANALPPEPIAIVGMSCRLPGGVDGPAAFWHLLVDEVDAVEDTVPATRWTAEQYVDVDRAAPGKTVTAAGGFLPAIERFDAEFFGISPREAAEMDPQQRLALELAWEAFEDAGVPPRAKENGPTGVYFAVKFNDYRALKIAIATEISPFTSTGDVEGIIANRISHCLGMSGPSLTVNASCAGSLIAVHLACQAIRSGDCPTALVGGVQLNIIPETAVGLSKLGVLSPHGRSRAFDAAGDGYVRSEGGGAIVLMSLADAVKQNRRIYCVVRGTATNNNGHNHSLPATSETAQRELLRRACERSGIDPGTVDYVEAHGTGTELGDRTELGALGAVYGTGRGADRPLLVGSVKTNIGHTEAAAGIAGLIKTALALRHRIIPRSLHYERDREGLDSAALNLRMTSRRWSWPEAADHPMRAGVSAFGFGGSNAHVIVEEPPHRAAPVVAEREQLLVLSGRTPAATLAQAARLRDYLLAHPDTPLAAVADTLGRGRTHFLHRVAVTATTVAEAVEALADVEIVSVTDESPWHEMVSDGAVGSSEAVRQWVRAFPAAELEGDQRHASLNALASLYRLGFLPDWSALAAPVEVLSLPTYPFQRESHWLRMNSPATSATVHRVQSSAVGQSMQPRAETLPDESTAAARVTGEFTRTVASEVAAVLGIAVAALDLGENFARVGIGSVQAVEISARLAAKLGIEVPTVVVWGHPSVLELAGHLATSSVPRAVDAPDESDADILSDAELLDLGRRLLG
ncbi:beta-ketoacyl synthase N-terminal-like domain-containing protein [Nocardia sp. NPDC020380]|uniref:type I polyketide synthase n=1 Tax=Nocardia sp. NPDC020380 TaxID=3364309 RepID=UPI00378B2038